MSKLYRLGIKMNSIYEPEGKYHKGYPYSVGLWECDSDGNYIGETIKVIDCAKHSEVTPAYIQLEDYLKGLENE